MIDSYKKLKCIPKRTLPKRNVIFPERLVQLLPRLHHIDYNYTKMIRVVPKILQLINLQFKTISIRARILTQLTQTDPAKVMFAILIFTHHVIATTVFFNSHIAFWAFFCICGYPIRCF